MDLLLEITEEGSSYLKTHEKIPEKLWQQWLVHFKNNNPPSFKENFQLSGRHDNIQEVLDYTFSSNPEFSIDLVEEYLFCKGRWSYKNFSNNYVLGDILETIIPIAYPDDPEPNMPEGPHFLPLKILLSGPAFSGKKTQAKKLQELYGLKIIEVPKILEDAKKVIQRRSEEESKKKKNPEEEPEVFIQACLETLGEDELGRSKLIRARLRGIFGDTLKLEEEIKKTARKEEVKCLGYLLMNYPNTIQEATDLERHMSNFIHPSELPEPLAIIKKREALIIAQPSTKPPQPKKLYRSAWDLIIFLEADLPVCLSRAADRRIDVSGNVYSVSHNPPAENILAKCKPIEHPNQQEIKDMYQEFSLQKETLCHWFSQFGSKGVGNLLIIKASQNADAITEVLKTRIYTILKNKNTPDVSRSPSQRNITIISIEQAQILASDWENLKKTYLSQLSYNLSYIHIHLDMFSARLQHRKNEFLNFLQEPDEKAELFQTFKENLINTITSQPILTSTEIQQLNQSIEELTDDIWDVIVTRKDNAINKRQEIIDSSIIPQQIAGILHITMNLLQTEVCKYYKVINFIEKYYYFLECKEFFQKTIPIIEINWQEWNVNLIGYPILDYLITAAKNSVVNSSEHSPETYIFLAKIENIRNFAASSIEKYIKMAEEMYLLMDVWICKAVELENTVMVKMVKNI